MPALTPCHLLPVVTPKGVALNALWFGPLKPRRVIIHVHGLGSSAFSSGVVERWADGQTAIVTFNNRGHDLVAGVKAVSPSGRTRRIWGGAAKETFTDCVDDIQGTVDAVKRTGPRHIYLSGHSTGCQKITYYASRTPDRAVRGLILLAPLSDYAGTEARMGIAAYRKTVAAARALVRRGEPHTLLPDSLRGRPISAQRWLSLYTPDSVEEIFTYATPGKVPRTLRKVTLPQLILLAQHDEYADRPALDIARWFAANASADCGTIQIIPEAGHGFKGAEKPVARLVRWWLGPAPAARGAAGRGRTARSAKK